MFLQRNWSSRSSNSPRCRSHVTQAVDEYKSAYPLQLKFDYAFKANEAPFDIQSIYHDDKFTYIKTNAPEKFSRL